MHIYSFHRWTTAEQERNSRGIFAGPKRGVIMGDSCWIRDNYPAAFLTQQSKELESCSPTIFVLKNQGKTWTKNANAIDWDWAETDMISRIGLLYDLATTKIAFFKLHSCKLTKTTGCLCMFVTALILKAVVLHPCYCCESVQRKIVSHPVLWIYFQQKSSLNKWKSSK